MRLPNPLALLRRLGVGGGASAGAAGLAAPLWRLITTPSAGPLRFDELLVRGCAVALLLCLLWAWLAVMAVVLESLGSTPTLTSSSSLGLPVAVRRLVLSLCGAALAASASPALASPGTDSGGNPEWAVPALMAGLPYPDRAMDADALTEHGSTPQRRKQTVPAVPRHDTPRPAASRPVSAQERTEGAVVVRRGDSLWTIAAGRLADASDEDVDRAWHALYLANRKVIGEDPSLITPGMRLELPEALR
ncbi:LysM peptidoglycan-binding domain-containing protein [Nocardioides sp. Kera G14]|uniref:LysM peptidoglycan-binding domain-containing protein n=1 Tax=Nocardioides sp. Kera G14 TaxID=2884264 RepID=UPI001D1129E3|nr:LysM domain-containing protein [Nocardioides sp. Kera G14]UDY24540.1 LysM peptidoglycan-binding domain-containing protein [Nocardioides sp. Kera G14]